jgi:hypothetical protein
MIRWVPVPTAGTTADPSWCSVSFHNSDNFLIFAHFSFKSQEVKGKVMFKTLYNVFNHMLNHVLLPLQMKIDDTA